MGLDQWVHLEHSTNTHFRLAHFQKIWKSRFHLFNACFHSKPTLRTIKFSEKFIVCSNPRAQIHQNSDWSWNKLKNTCIFLGNVCPNPISIDSFLELKMVFQKPLHFLFPLNGIYPWFLRFLKLAKKMNPCFLSFLKLAKNQIPAFWAFLSLQKIRSMFLS